MSWWLLLLSCAGNPDLDSAQSGPFHEGSPVITHVKWGCDQEDMDWDFEVRTEHWTGAGWLRMAKSSEYAELHRMPSVEAAGDGSTDRLRLSLNIAQDWRSASSGSSSAWRCRDESVLTYMITVYDTSGETVTDCRTWGPNPEIWAQISGVHQCENILEGTGDTGQ